MCDVTAGGVGTEQQVKPLPEEFGRLVADCDDYQLIPLLVAAAGTSATTTTQALDIVRVVGGAVVLTVSTSQSAYEIEAQVLEAGNHLGYLRLLAEELDGVAEDDVAGLLATVPVHVPVAIGSMVPDPAPTNPAATDRAQADLATRAHAWSQLIDRMLEHPLAGAHRLSTGG